MKKLPYALLTAASCLLACGKKEKAAEAPATPPVDGDLVISAELVELPGPFPSNDLYNYAYVMKYKVLKVHRGSYPDGDILIGQYNPRLAREEIRDEQDAKVGGNARSFRIGDVHYLVLAGLDESWSGALEDDYFKDRRRRYWALWTDRL